MWRAMAGHGVPLRGIFARHVLHHLFFHRFPSPFGLSLSKPAGGLRANVRSVKNMRIPSRHQPRVVVGLAPQHHAINQLQLLLRFVRWS
jgi:hypothetical protein